MNYELTQRPGRLDGARHIGGMGGAGHDLTGENRTR